MTAPLRILSPQADEATFRDPSTFCLAPTASVRDAITCLDRNGKGIVLATDAERRLVGTITDGDVRRAVLAGQDLDTPLQTLLDKKAADATSRYSHPITVPSGTGRAEMLQLMQQQVVHQLPVLDDDGRVIDLVTTDDLVPEPMLPVQAVIMAGGFGTRLRPLTLDTPKPMLPVGDRPLMERSVQKLQQAGVRRVSITTYYKPEKIVEHFGDGRRFGIELDYVNEDSPLGTAGALTLLERWDEPLLVMNGDILTSINFKSVFKFHKEHDAALTVAVRKYDIHVPYGVVDCEGGVVRGIREKPLFSFFVNAGIYLLEPDVRKSIPDGQRFDMPDLISRLVEEGRTVASFPILEYWLDIGKLGDYEQAQRDVQEGRVAA